MNYCKSLRLIEERTADGYKYWIEYEKKTTTARYPMPDRRQAEQMFGAFEANVDEWVKEEK